MTDRATPCVEHADVYLHPFLHGDSSPTTTRERGEQQQLVRRAEQLCAGCPLLAKCLHDAVVRHEISGFAAGTTQRERQEIRRQLNVTVSADDLDSFTGVAAGRHFDPYEILRVRAANPGRPLSVIAAKIGCSVSTVKRHLQRADRAGDIARPANQQAPTPGEVMDAARALRRDGQRNAA